MKVEDLRPEDFSWYDTLLGTIEKATIECHREMMAESKNTPPSFDALLEVASRGADKLIIQLGQVPITEFFAAVAIAVKALFINMLVRQQKFIEAQRPPESGGGRLGEPHPWGEA